MQPLAPVHSSYKQQILDTPFEKLRGIGLSNAKVSYVQNVAQFENDYGMAAKKLSKMIMLVHCLQN